MQAGPRQEQHSTRLKLLRIRIVGNTAVLSRKPKFWEDFSHSICFKTLPWYFLDSPPPTSRRNSFILTTSNKEVQNCSEQQQTEDLKHWKCRSDYKSQNGWNKMNVFGKPSFGTGRTIFWVNFSGSKVNMRRERFFPDIEYVSKMGWYYLRRSRIDFQ